MVGLCSFFQLLHHVRGNAKAMKSKNAGIIKAIVLGALSKTAHRFLLSSECPLSSSYYSSFLSRAVQKYTLSWFSVPQLLQSLIAPFLNFG